MKQQTAVEWLDRWFRDNYEATYEEGNKAFEQAKQMEKDKAIEFAKYALEEITVIDWYNYKDFEEIYNKFNNPQNQIK